MHLRLIRHATLLIHIGAHRLLVDPMLDPPGAHPPEPGSADERRNPLVELPEPAEVVVSGIDGVVVTRLHANHLDETAQRLLPSDVPLLCRPADADALRERGFADVRAIERELEWNGVRFVRAGVGDGADADASGFVAIAAEEPVLYVVGDRVWGDPVRNALAEHEPDVVVVNAGAAQLAGGERRTMTAEEVVAVARAAPQARIVAVHLEAIGHCAETRADVHQRIHEEDLRERVTVPEDGAEVPVMPVGG